VRGESAAEMAAEAGTQGLRLLGIDERRGPGPAEVLELRVVRSSDSGRGVFCLAESTPALEATSLALLRRLMREACAT